MLWQDYPTKFLQMMLFKYPCHLVDVSPWLPSILLVALTLLFPTVLIIQFRRENHKGLLLLITSGTVVVFFGLWGVLDPSTLSLLLLRKLLAILLPGVGIMFISCSSLWLELEIASHMVPQGSNSNLPDKEPTQAPASSSQHPLTPYQESSPEKRVRQIREDPDYQRVFNAIHEDTQRILRLQAAIDAQAAAQDDGVMFNEWVHTDKCEDKPVVELPQEPMQMDGPKPKASRNLPEMDLDSVVLLKGEGPQVRRKLDVDLVANNGPDFYGRDPRDFDITATPESGASYESPPSYYSPAPLPASPTPGNRMYESEHMKLPSLASSQPSDCMSDGSQSSELSQHELSSDEPSSYPASLGSVTSRDGAPVVVVKLPSEPKKGV